MNANICLVTGIYPPDIGGPAKFAESFALWNTSSNQNTINLSYTSGPSLDSVNLNNRVILISRKYNIFSRYLRMIIQILRISNKKYKILANGCFVEVYLASLISKSPYTLKIPGDIVWEHATNNLITDSNIMDFQSQKFGLKYSLFRFIFNKSLQRAKKVIVPSNQLRELCLIWGVQPTRIELVNNSISLEVFNDRKFKKRDIDVLTVTRLVSWKNVNRIIEVCSNLSLSLYIVGDGPEMTSLANLSKELGAKVVFCGALPQRDLPAIYGRAKIFVLNSTFEATSYSLLEARASGCLSIANLGTGSEQVINHEVDGLLADPNDGHSLQKLIEFCLENPEKVESMINIAQRRIASEFNAEINFKKIFEISSL
ncbi:MAG: glycosyltransferase family 4 protein [Terrimicrobiaceae bacterium]